MDNKLSDINLLPQYERRRGSSGLIYILLIILVIAAFAYVGTTYFMTKSNLEKLDREYASLTENADTLTTELNALESDSTTTKDDAVSFVSGHTIPTSIFIVELFSLLPEHSYLSSYNYSSLQANITTQFEALDDVAQYTNRLTHSDYTRDAKVNRIHTFDWRDFPESYLTEFDVISRYEATFSLDVDKWSLKGAAKEDE